MRWSFSIGRLFGIPIRVHATFFLLLALVAFVAYRPGQPMTVWPMALVLAIFACILGHELAHSLTAMGFGVEVDSITLLPIGGMAAVSSMPQKAWQEVLVALAGPAFSLAVAGVVYLVSTQIVEEPFRWELIFAGNALRVDTAWLVLAALGPINVVIAVVNLFPAFPLDGGRVLRGVLALKLPLVKATRIAAALGETAAVFLILYGLTAGPNVMLIVIGIFLLMGALSEEQSVEIDAVFEDMKVKRVMLTEFRRVSESEHLLNVVDLMCRTGQTAVPVTDDSGHYLGLIDMQSIGGAIRRRGTRSPVTDALREDHTETDPEDQIAGVYETMVQRNFDGMAVLEEGLLKGLVLRDHVKRLFQLNRAIQEAPAPKKP